MRMRSAAVILPSLACTLALVAALGPRIQAGVVRLGPEFQVNTYTTDLQGDPAVGIDAGGRFVVAWISVEQDGDNFGIFGRRFDRTGDPLGDEFQVNTYTSLAQQEPAVAMDPSGTFVVVWRSDGQDGDNYGIFGQRFDSAGDPLGLEFQVNSHSTSIQYQPDVAAAPTGEFIVVWTSLNQDGGSFGIFGRRFDSDGMPEGLEFRVNTYTTSVQKRPSIAIDDSGGFVIAWESIGQDGQAGGIFGQRFDGIGVPVGGEFQVNTYTTGDQVRPNLAVQGGGAFLVVWESAVSTSPQLRGRRYDSSGLPDGGEFQVASPVTYGQNVPVAASEATGGFVVTWEQYYADDWGKGIAGRRINADGALVTAEFLVNTYTPNTQRAAAARMNGAGDLVVVWHGPADGSSYGISGQRFFGRAPELSSHVNGDMLDCSDPAVTRPAFTWDPDGYEKFRVSLSSTSGFLKGSVVTSGDTLLSGTTWSPSKKKWRKACAKAVAANPVSPVLFVKILGKDTDLSKRDRDRLRESAVVMGSVQP